MNIKLNITLLDCKGSVTPNSLKEAMKEILFGAENFQWHNAGLTNIPTGFKVQVSGIESEDEDE